MVTRITDHPKLIAGARQQAQIDEFRNSLTVFSVLEFYLRCRNVSGYDWSLRIVPEGLTTSFSELETTETG